MKEIKTKSIIKDIKILDKAADVSRRAKNAYIRTKEKAGQTQQPEHDSFTEYAEDRIKEGTDTVTHEVGRAVEYQGKKAVQKIKERRNARLDTSPTDTADGYTSEQTSYSETGNPQRSNRSATSSKEKKAATSKVRKTSEQYNIPVQAKQSAQQKTVQSRVKETVNRKYTLSKPNELAKRRFVQTRVKARFAKNREIQAADAKTTQPIQNPVFRPTEKITWSTGYPNFSGSGRTVKQSAQSGGKTTKKTAKGTIKTAQKSIKTDGQTVKTRVKTSQASAKAASKSAQATAKAAQRIAQAAKTTARFTARIVKLTVKATAALVKGLAALVGTGGAILVLFLIIIAVAALVSSPLGIFFSSENNDAEVTPISNVVQEVNIEFTARIEDIKTAHSYVDSVEIHYSGSADNIMVGYYVNRKYNLNSNKS